MAQEDVGDMGLSSPSEQVAYSLEETTMIEWLKAAVRRLERQSFPDNWREVHFQVKD